MAKIPSARGGKGSGELLHIVILTAFMTGGFLALISGVFHFFVIPDREKKLAAQVKDHNDLAALLDPRKTTKAGKEIYELRDRYRAATKNQSTKTIREMVTEQLGGLTYSRLPPTTFKGVQQKSATKESIQQIELKEAPISEILSFIGRVKQANPGIQVGHVGLTRRLRGGPAAPAGAAAPAGLTAPADDDKWNASIDFYAYITEAKGGAARAVPKTEAPPSAEGQPATPEGAPSDN